MIATNPIAVTSEQAVYITVGQHHVVTADDAGVVVKTLLGSCVSACMCDPVARVGGMNHFLLPNTQGDDGLAGWRYGSYAMEALINKLLHAGALRHRLHIKLFGAAHVHAGLPQIGLLNAAFARAYLEREGLSIVSEDMGGTYARKLEYNPHTGQVYIKKIQHMAAEQKQKELSFTFQAGTVELFE